MEWYHYLLIGLGVVLFAFISVILIRTLLFTPKKTQSITGENIEFDKENAVDCLRQLVQCKTISIENRDKEDNAEFDKLINLLPKLYPLVIEKCSKKTFGNRAILFKWEGKSNKNPTVLMSHYDVVPVNEQFWDKPPFEGVIENGVLWGRGTLDTKSSLNSAMFSVNHLISQGYVPENDVYLAFSGEEEINGNGALKIVEYLSEQNVTPALVLDEGGAVVENVFPGVKKPCGLIGVAEKGMLNLSYTVKSNGGHASAPKPNSPIVKLSRVCDKIEKSPFKLKITPPVKMLFDRLGRESTFVYRMIFSNLWLFKGVINKICIKNGGDLNALLRTTVAFTQMQGSSAFNVIPSEAHVVSNIRLNPYDDVETAVEYIKKTINDKDVSVNVLSAYNPSKISKTNAESYQKVENALQQTWKNAIVSPYLMVQCSDSRHYCSISDKIYKFSAMDLTNEERSSIHGNNERIRLETIYKSAEFYIRLLKNC